MSVWVWFHEFQRHAAERKDRDRLRLCQVHDQAYNLREKDPDQALRIFTEARQLAQQLGESWMVLFYDHWRLTALMHFKRDYRNVLELAVQTALEVRKPLYTAYPGRFTAFEDLIDAYTGIDPAGYADVILDAMAYLDRELPPGCDGEGRYALLGSQRIFYQELDRLDEAYEWAMKTMEIAEGDQKRHRRGALAGLHLLCAVRDQRQRGDWETLAGLVAKAVMRWLAGSGIRWSCRS